jgi:hypothetical protein
MYFRLRFEREKAKPHRSRSNQSSPRSIRVMKMRDMASVNVFAVFYGEDQECNFRYKEGQDTGCVAFVAGF